jgi:hypothetical protein
LKVLLATEPLLNNYSTSGQHQASKDIVIDALWADETKVPEDVDNALSHAKSTLNRALRLFLGDQDLILRTDGSDKTGYQLNLTLVTIDADEFEQLCIQASEAEGRGDEERALQCKHGQLKSTSVVVCILDRLIHLLKGKGTG